MNSKYILLAMICFISHTCDITVVSTQTRHGITKTVYSNGVIEFTRTHEIPYDGGLSAYTAGFNPNNRQYYHLLHDRDSITCPSHNAKGGYIDLEQKFRV